MRLTRAWSRGLVAVNLPVRPAELTHPGVRPTLLLRDIGFDVHVVTRGDRSERAIHDGVTVWVEAGTTAALRRVSALGPELLFVESSTYGTVLAGLAQHSWIRNPRLASRPRVRRIQRLALRQFDAVSFTNAAEKRLWKVSPRQEAELAYPVDVSWWHEHVERQDAWWTKRGWKVPRGPVLVCNSAFERHKRHSELLEWLAPLLGADRSMVLVLFGHRWLEPDIWEMVRSRPRELGIADQVLVTDWLSHEEIRQLLAWASLTIINSRRETQCLAVYEALAAGVPTLISEIPELVAQFPGLPAHTNGRGLRANVQRVLGEAGFAQRLLNSAQPRLAWVDIGRHDRLFQTTVERLVGRRLGAAPNR